MPGSGIRIYFHEAERVVASHAARRIAVGLQHCRVVAPVDAARPDELKGQGSDRAALLFLARHIRVRLALCRTHRAYASELVVAVDAHAALAFQTTRIFRALINI